MAAAKKQRKFERGASAVQKQETDESSFTVTLFVADQHGPDEEARGVLHVCVANAALGVSVTKPAAPAYRQLFKNEIDDLVLTGKVIENEQ